MTLAVCNECGGTDLEGYAMCKINEEQAGSPKFCHWSDSGEPDECYCNTCEEWTTFTYKNQEVDNEIEESRREQTQ